MSDIRSALDKLRQAERDLAAAKLAHRAEFIGKLVSLCNEYQLTVFADGSEGAHLDIGDDWLAYPVSAEDMGLK
jgi:hypothetical protein